MSKTFKTLALCASLLVLFSAVAHGAATITIVNNDGAGEGFNDMTAATPVAGNPGTTLGQQRLNVFQAAADAWGQILNSDVEIRVESNIDPLPCDASSAVLGAAGTIFVFRGFPNAPRALTWFHSALADAIAGVDLATGEPDIGATFNGDIDGNNNCLNGLDWWYGIGAPAPSGTIDFYTTVLHEIGHGIGFSTFVNSATGQRFQDVDDIFMVNLVDQSIGMPWTQMTDPQRRNSSIDTGDLLWTGANVVSMSGMLNSGVHPTGRVQMYAPNPLEPGSSVSHWDTALQPNELMEPFLTADAQDILTTKLLQDLGWSVGGGGPTGCMPDNNTLCLNNDRFQVRVNWRDFSGNTGPGIVVPFGSDDSGLFWFFNANNWEMLIKVLNGCTINNHFWVFAAATTDVEYELTVTDTQTGEIVTYNNPLGVASPAITDTGAFATCP